MNQTFGIINIFSNERDRDRDRDDDDDDDSEREEVGDDKIVEDVDLGDSCADVVSCGSEVPLFRVVVPVLVAVRIDSDPSVPML